LDHGNTSRRRTSRYGAFYEDMLVAHAYCD